MTLLETCLPLFEAAGARQPDPSIRMWDLEARGWSWSTKWRAFPGLQGAVLRGFLAESPYLHMDSADVLLWATTSTWPRPLEHTFQLPANVDAGELTREVLYTGSYMLYVSARAVDETSLSFDPWRRSPSETERLLGSLGVDALIAAFPDNDSWRIVFPLNEAAAG